MNSIPGYRFTITCLSLCLVPLVLSCARVQKTPSNLGSNEQVTLAFGSCLRQWDRQPVWQSITALKPEAFIFLGDNMYSDVGEYLNLKEPERIEKAYHDLGEAAAFRQFSQDSRQNGTEFYATWDDHDYGENDGGGDYAYKLDSKRFYLQFFDLPNTVSGDASQPGIYQSHRLQEAGLDIQLILLDTRSFRSPINKDPHTEDCPKTQTVPNTDTNATVLGTEQWLWLEQELRQPADLRIIASSIQVIAEDHCFEKWANFPQERARLFKLIKTTKAEAVVLISGDRHLAEISKLSASVIGYPIYEITSSGLNSAMGPGGALFNETNRFRVKDTVFNDNFGAISLIKNADSFDLELKIYEANGDLATSIVVPVQKLSY